MRMRVTRARVRATSLDCMAIAKLSLLAAGAPSRSRVLGTFARFGTVANEPKRCVLGIETSCDDTGVAIVSENGTILGERVDSQTNFSVE